ncbi:hypothetical protein KQX54_008830 [Cotesia glomerata]|uniref:Uncharacterized protein n=1 Tax=Cotesia glomerata TaxID=32391 RepID=A0AAV7J2H8_COTGL|nr:hypothetical protein KQX54_008830 [Cotesia glomerata]
MSIQSPGHGQRPARHSPQETIKSSASQSDTQQRGWNEEGERERETKCFRLRGYLAVSEGRGNIVWVLLCVRMWDGKSGLAGR